MRSLHCASLFVAVVAASSGCVDRGPQAVAPVGGSATSWRYDVEVDDGARRLLVDAWLPPGSLADLVVRHGAERFVQAVEVQDDDGWRTVSRRGEAFHVPECARGCHLRYRFALRRAADALRDIDVAIAWGEVVVASPSSWLLHPTLAPDGTRYRFHVRAARDASFVTGVFTAPDGPPGSYEADATDIAVAPYAAFGPMRLRSVEAVPGSTLDVAIAGDYRVDDDAIVAWMAKSSRTIARFLGCFPVERVMVLVVPAAGDAVRHGETMGDGGAAMVLELGEDAGPAALEDDWVLPHEMAHLAVPSVAPRHHWIEEGLAVYLQPIARARAGELTPEQVWREFAMGMPKGAPSHADRGLDDATDWARTYWGGATFCLVADVAIRTRTGNRFGLEDAMRGVLAAGGSVAHIWGLERLLDTADGSVGAGPLLARMHAEMLRGTWTVDLPGLFRDLGVHLEGTRVTFDDAAPLAALRRSITRPLLVGEPEPVACRATPGGTVAQR
ncbi:MAG TPA: hypothetical protein VGG39_30565 [Polyangiaceae bacterium]|jgi:hypothetical protein